MKRLTVLSARALIVLLLALAVVDVRLPGTSRDRRRLHLIDRSASVLLEGGLLPKDADALRAADAPAPGDAISWASFGRNVSFESTRVDPGGTDLAGALEAALARNPTEIVLYTDGRADPGRALFLCRSREVPVHVFPLGPVSPRDVRLSRIQAPARLAPGEAGTVEVTVESTFAAAAKVRVGPDSRDVTLSPGIPLAVPFPVRGPGPFDVRVEAEDELPRNNAVRGEIDVRSGKRKILVLSPSDLQLPEFDAKPAAAYEQPRRFDAVILAGLRLGPDEQKDLARYAAEGGGVLLLGGRRSHDLGGWRGTPLEEISPLRAAPDQKVAVAFGIDSSGSMKEVWDTVCDAVLRAREGLGSGDAALAYTFATDVRTTGFDDLRRAWTGGPTYIARGIRKGRELLQPLDAGRKHLFLFTDGQAAAGERPEEQRGEAELLERGGIALTVITTDRRIDAPRARQVKIDHWAGLEGALADLFRGLRDNEKSSPGALELQEHPATRGVPRVDLPWMNLTTAKPQGRVVGTVGRAPALYPAVAFGTVGQGTVGAFAFEPQPGLHRLLVQSIEHVAGRPSDLSLSIEPPLLRARGKAKDARLEASVSGRTVLLEQVRSDVWEGTLPPLEAGTVFARCGQATASATLPCSPEDAALGVDRKALERIARETGGRLLRSSDDLAALPRPARPEPRSGRPLCLLAALALLFAELAVTTFWKER